MLKVHMYIIINYYLYFSLKSPHYHIVSEKLLLQQTNKEI